MSYKLFQRTIILMSNTLIEIGVRIKSNVYLAI